MRLSDAFGRGCPVCTVRARSERAMLDTIIAERVLDIPFRESLERTQGFCRRHVAELVLAAGAGRAASSARRSCLARCGPAARAAARRPGAARAVARTRLTGARSDRRASPATRARARSNRAGPARDPDRRPGMGRGDVERAVLPRRPRRALAVADGAEALRADRRAPGRAASRRSGRACRASSTTRPTIAGTCSRTTRARRPVRRPTCSAGRALTLGPGHELDGRSRPGPRHRRGRTVDCVPGGVEWRREPYAVSTDPGASRHRGDHDVPHHVGLGRPRRRAPGPPLDRGLDRVRRLRRRRPGRLRPRGHGPGDLRAGSATSSSSRAIAASALPCGCRAAWWRTPICRGCAAGR